MIRDSTSEAGGRLDRLTLSVTVAVTVCPLRSASAKRSQPPASSLHTNQQPSARSMTMWATAGPRGVWTAKGEHSCRITNTLSLPGSHSIHHQRRELHGAVALSWRHGAHHFSAGVNDVHARALSFNLPRPRVGCQNRGDLRHLGRFLPVQRQRCRRPASNAG